MTTFEIGTTYFMRSPCDHNCIWEYEVARRSAKSVWLKDSEGKVTRRAIKVWSDVETCSPLGTYSMSPILSADRPCEW